MNAIKVVSSLFLAESEFINQVLPRASASKTQNIDKKVSHQRFVRLKLLKGAVKSLGERMLLLQLQAAWRFPDTKTYIGPPVVRRDKNSLTQQTSSIIGGLASE